MHHHNSGLNNFHCKMLLVNAVYSMAIPQTSLTTYPRYIMCQNSSLQVLIIDILNKIFIQ